MQGNQLEESEGMNSLTDSLDILGDGQSQPEASNIPETVEEISNAENPTDHSEEMGDSEFHSEGESEKKEESEESAEEQPKAAANEVQIRAFKQDHKFNLDPEDEQLRKTLSLGVAAPKWKHKLDTVSSELADLKKSSKVNEDRAQVWDELRELRDSGHYEEVVRMILDDKFEDFRNSMLEEYRVGVEGSEAEKYELERAKFERARKYQEEQLRKEKEQLRGELERREDAARETQLRSTGEALLRKYDMSQYVDDLDEAQELNESLWELAWSDVNRQYGEGDELPSSLDIQRAFARRAKLLRGGRERAAENQVREVTESKKAEAREAAKMAATKNYPSKAAVDIDKIKKVKSAKELFSLF